VINQAATRARQCNVNSALVIGHTDTSGARGYNGGLSQRRANVVREALIARGVSPDLIRTEFRGEADLAVMTADGVREAANRRATITISFR
jgi:outer membrane protein OmpA-like peptidoglycan-associated protein